LAHEGQNSSFFADRQRPASCTTLLTPPSCKCPNLQCQRLTSARLALTEEEEEEEQENTLMIQRAWPLQLDIIIPMSLQMSAEFLLKVISALLSANCPTKISNDTRFGAYMVFLK